MRSEFQACPLRRTCVSQNARSLQGDARGEGEPGEGESLMRRKCHECGELREPPENGTVFWHTSAVPVKWRLGPGPQE